MDVDVEPQPQPQPHPQSHLHPQPHPQPQPQLQSQPQVQTQQSPTHHGTVSDTGLPVQSIQESVDSRGNKIVIIEELDTPATRREKTRRAKAVRARLAAEVVTHATSFPEASGSGERDYVAAPAHGGPALDPGQEESDLSSLSGDSDEVTGGEEVQASTSAGRGRGRGRGRGQKKGKTGHLKSPGLGNISLPPDERLESGTLGISPRHSLRTVPDGDRQFGQNISRTLGGAPSCTMTTYRRFRRTSCNGVIMRETTL